MRRASHEAEAGNAGSVDVVTSSDLGEGTADSISEATYAGVVVAMLTQDGIKLARLTISNVASGNAKLDLVGAVVQAGPLAIE